MFSIAIRGITRVCKYGPKLLLTNTTTKNKLSVRRNGQFTSKNERFTKKCCCLFQYSIIVSIVWRIRVELRNNNEDCYKKKKKIWFIECRFFVSSGSARK